MTISTTQRALRRALPESHEVIADACDERGIKEVARELKVSAALAYKWSEDPGTSGAMNPLDRVLALCLATGTTRPIEWLAEKLGGAFVASPVVSPQTDACLNRLATGVLVEVTTFAHTFVKAAEDRLITAEEAMLIRDAWGRADRTGESAVLTCEAGHFSASAG